MPASTAHQGRRALILYGSETGHAHDVAEELGSIAARLHLDVHVTECNAITLRQLLQYSVVLISISTTGQGELPANCQTFWKALRSTRLRPGCLQHLRFASFGLGDTSYPKFNWAHRKLYNRLVQLGAQPICDRGESDEQHPEGVDGSFLPWTAHLRHRLLEEYPLPAGVAPIADDVLLDPKWLLQPTEGAASSPHSAVGAASSSHSAVGAASSSHSVVGAASSSHSVVGAASSSHSVVGAASSSHSVVGAASSSHSVVGAASSHSAVAPASSFPHSHVNISHAPPADLLHRPPGGMAAKVVSNTRLTSATHWQHVCHLTLDVSHYHPYLPGDVLAIRPKNFPTDVNLMLKLMDWDSIADSPLQFISSSPTISSTSPLPIPNISPNATITLRTLLTNHLDLMSIPRRSFFAKIAHFTSDQFHRDRLLEFTNPEYIDELYDYTSRPRRSILEVLQEFESVKIPWQRICSVIPAIRARQFSIASAQAPHAEAKGKTRIELCIAIVKYKTIIKRTRQGVCTRYVAALEPGQEISVALQKGGLGVTKKDMEKPVVMIGPGTGVAPMRALIHQRKYWRQESENASGSGPRDILFFGCRNAEADYLFKEEWEALKKEGVPLDVFPAFSRDQRQKVYVQDLVRKHSVQVYDALFTKGGIVYICGSSGKMPQAVREALIECFQSHGSQGREEAEVYLARMEKTGRYMQETW